MTVNFTVQANGIILITVIGKNTVNDYVSTMRDIARDESARGLNRFLIDTTQVESTLSSDQLGQLAKLLGSSKSDQRTAVVVSSDAQFGKTRMYQSMADDPTMNIFSTVEDATDWLLEST